MVSPTIAGPAMTELPAACDHRIFPVAASRANIVGFAGFRSIDPTNTTPLPTLAGPSPMQPCAAGGIEGEHCPGTAVCQRRLPVAGSSAAHDPPLTRMLLGLSAYGMPYRFEIGT